MTDFATIAELEVQIDRIVEQGVRPLGLTPPQTPSHDASELLRLGEAVLEVWIAARGETPTYELKEGFRLLALHRQGAKGEPSFNACRETARELVYHYNLIAAAPEHPETARRLKLMGLVARHLLLFVGGKMETSGLGEFCCAAKPVRQGEQA